ncbi:hypothetical protein SAMN05421825_2787 [Epilithonimonas hungarica]|uniref:Uncharacterized protein n=1 Tax=Epilithonimonas hungarica TaxID=454006 RepID=A0A1G7RV35_9FLAO|nr:hypothetical protein SAMN05421825_2787 [Epilithonimonas hungarica]
MKIEFALFKIIYEQCRNSQPPILITKFLVQNSTEILIKKSNYFKIEQQHYSFNILSVSINDVRISTRCFELNPINDILKTYNFSDSEVVIFK